MVVVEEISLGEIRQFRKLQSPLEISHALCFGLGEAQRQLRLWSESGPVFNASGVKWQLPVRRISKPKSALAPFG